MFTQPLDTPPLQFSKKSEAKSQRCHIVLEKHDLNYFFVREQDIFWHSGTRGYCVSRKSASQETLQFYETLLLKVQGGPRKQHKSKLAKNFKSYWPCGKTVVTQLTLICHPEQNQTWSERGLGQKRFEIYRSELRITHPPSLQPSQINHESRQWNTMSVRVPSVIRTRIENMIALSVQSTIWK